MKKLVGMVLVGCLVLGNLNVFASVPSFTDLKSTNWAYEAVNTMSQKGIVKGYNDGSFKPGNVVTYGEFIKMALVAATGEDVGNSTKGNWAKSYYDKAIELKFFTNSQIKEIQLNNPIPRGDMALIISSAIDYIAGEEVQYGTNTGKGTSTESLIEVVCNNISDVSDKTANIQDIVKVYASGIINGYEDNTFKPEKTLTRAESATVICRLIDKDSRVTPNLKKLKSVDEILNTVSLQGKETIGEFLGVRSAKQLKIEKPMTYYSFAIPSQEKKPISEMIINGEEIKSATFDCKYYKIVNPQDIGLTAIKKTVDKYNCEQIEVFPGDGATNAFLIKNKKIICNLSSADGNGTEKATLFFPGTSYYNGAWENTKLMDFDYIGFWGSTGDTIFLVSNPF